MNISAVSIRRPIATTLLTLALVLAGLTAFVLLPVAPLPKIDFPTIVVTTRMPGAGPETMASTVAAPLERQLGKIAGLTEMTSSSALANTRITLQFDLDRDIDGAAKDVQAAINSAQGQLPTLPQKPDYHKANPADAPIMVIVLTSDNISRGDIYDAASSIIVPRLSQIEGIGQVEVGGSSMPAVRVELNPNALYQYGISLEQVSDALKTANAYMAKGSVENGDKHWQINANDQLHKAVFYKPLIVAYRNGAPVRLSDVADVIDSVQDVYNVGYVNGKLAVPIILRAQPNANVITTVGRVTALLPQLRASIPASITLMVTMDRTKTIRASLHEVESTLVISVALVLMVVLLFLRNARTAIIPTAAVVASLIGTFCAMYLLEFSLNNISLMALTVAACFVVDDAVVVVENISRHIERGLSPIQAAFKGAKEVGFTVLTMSLSLIAVFIPVLLMGGIIGRIFREFAVTLSVAVLISLAISLTTTPMMCALMLKKNGNTDHAAGIREQVFNKILSAYGVSLEWALSHKRLVMALLLATIGMNIYLYIIVPKGFFPMQDTGRLQGGIQTDQSSSFKALQPKIKKFTEIVAADPAVNTAVGFGDDPGWGALYVSLKPLKERDASAAQVIKRLRDKTASESGAQLFLRSSQDIRMGGRSSNAEYQYTLQGEDINELKKWAKILHDEIEKNTDIEVESDLQDKGLQAFLRINREAASCLGVTVKAIDSALGNGFGQREISTIYSNQNQYHVVMEVAPEYAQGPQSLDAMHVFSDEGKTVPLQSVSDHQITSAPVTVNHQDGFVSTTLTFDLPDNMALSEATDQISTVAERIGMPGNISGSFQGTAKAFQASLTNQPWLILAALAAAYIMLGILYESYVHPLTVLSTLPSAGVGALVALILMNMEFSVMALIGVILLIGIVQKNAILMIDFALAAKQQGSSSRKAIYQAGLLRFRPIMMTTMAAIFGALPLAIGFGEGSELRRPLGVAIVGGLLVSQLLTLYSVPVIYLYLDRFSLWCQRLSDETKTMGRFSHEEF